jgi:hypothetical protein
MKDYNKKVEGKKKVEWGDEYVERKWKKGRKVTKVEGKEVRKGSKTEIKARRKDISI